MNAFKTMVFSLAALGAVSLAAPAAAATTILTYVGSEFTSRSGSEPVGDRITATLELADPLSADFTGAVSWLSFTISDGVRTLSAPYTGTVTRFATDADGKIINWQVQATVLADDLLIIIYSLNAVAGQFGAAGGALDSAQYYAGQGLAIAGVQNNPGVWTVTTRADPGVVPEPGTWALMILGFGLTGAGLRRRRRLVA